MLLLLVVVAFVVLVGAGVMVHCCSFGTCNGFFRPRLPDSPLVLHHATSFLITMNDPYCSNTSN